MRDADRSTEGEAERTANHDGGGTTGAEWDAYFRQTPYPEGYEGNPAIVREILDLYPDLTGRRLLEVGPGSGVDAAHLADLGAQVSVVDPSATCVDRIAAAYPGRIVAIQGDGFQLPFASGTFDLVFSQGLLEHFPDPIDMLREQARVTRTGGHVIVDVPQTFSLWTLKKVLLLALGRWFVSYETQYTERRLRRLIARVPELSVVRFFGHKLSPSFLPQPGGAAFERSWLARHVCVSIAAVARVERRPGAP